MNYLHTANLDFAGSLLEFCFWLFCGAVGIAAATLVIAGLIEWWEILKESRNGN